MPKLNSDVCDPPLLLPSKQKNNLNAAERDTTHLNNAKLLIVHTENDSEIYSITKVTKLMKE